MCYIQITKTIGDRNLTNAHADLVQSIKQLAKDKMVTNDDGFFVGSPQKIVRTLNKKDAEQAIDEVDIDSMLYHCRFATTGAVNINNVHGWEIGGWVFAHNGTVDDYSNKAWDFDKKTYVVTSKTDKTDSLVLFENIVSYLQNRKTTKNKHVAKAIRKAVNKVSFWGRALMYDKSTDRLFLFGDWWMYLVVDSYLLITSSSISFEKNRKITTHGLSFSTPSGANIAEGEFDGIGVIENFSKKDFEFKKLGELKTYAYSGGNSIGFSARDDFDDPVIDSAKSGKVSNLGQTFFMYNKRGEIVECFEDGFGVHDIDGKCCMTDECDEFQEVSEVFRNEIHREKLPF